MKKPTDPRFHKGISEFNSGKFFEAHETWEELWHETTGHEKVTLQGFIQVTVAFHHLKNGNKKGARYLYGRFSKKLEQTGKIFWGVDIATLLFDTQRCFIEPLEYRPEQVPSIQQFSE